MAAGELCEKVRKRSAKNGQKQTAQKSAKTSEKVQKRLKTIENGRKSEKMIGVLFVDRFSVIFQWPYSGGHLGFPYLQDSLDMTKCWVVIQACSRAYQKHALAFMRTLVKPGEVWRTLPNPQRHIHENLPDVHRSSGEGPPHSPSSGEGAFCTWVAFRMWPSWVVISRK